MLGALSLALSTLNAASKLHQSMLMRILRSPMSFFDTTPLGNVLNRIGNDVYNIDSTIPGAFQLLVNLLVSTMANVIIIW